MAKQESRNETAGTFARLYDVQEEMSRRHAKPLGRPPKKIQRKPTTVHLTSAEKRSLMELKLMLDDYCSINQSELIGVAIEALSCLMQNEGQTAIHEGQISDLETFKRVVREITTS